jgi:hypothetical protein
VAFESPSVPVLLQILSGAKNASDLLPSASIYGLEANKSVELTIPALAIGGPVRMGVLITVFVMHTYCSENISTLFTCMG